MLDIIFLTVVGAVACKFYAMGAPWKAEVAARREARVSK